MAQSYVAFSLLLLFQLWYQYDKDRSGFIEADELKVRKLLTFYVKLFPLFVHLIKIFVKISIYWEFNLTFYEYFVQH